MDPRDPPPRGLRPNALEVDHMAQYPLHWKMALGAPKAVRDHTLAKLAMGLVCGIHVHYVPSGVIRLPLRPHT